MWSSVAFFKIGETNIAWKYINRQIAIMATSIIEQISLIDMIDMNAFQKFANSSSSIFITLLQI